jgi:hypothetical protein
MLGCGQAIEEGFDLLFFFRVCAVREKLRGKPLHIIR